ncbi:hypothetical protein DPEC_G00002120 [Dallia pectoralis]|uniref:Uncharacterized protein n=1 Tax=Dallia pectoralis TaxID=75939 RepID=A0ACC2HIX5_DALPE|nr:hypothetical protein DPEC_G00002120 [Dallia pectoralis]
MLGRAEARTLELDVTLTKVEAQLQKQEGEPGHREALTQGRKESCSRERFLPKAGKRDIELQHRGVPLPRVALPLRHGELEQKGVRAGADWTTPLGRHSGRGAG